MHMMDLNCILIQRKLYSAKTTHFPLHDLLSMNHPPPPESVSEVKIRKEVSEGWDLSTPDTTHSRLNETENIFKHS